MRAISFTLFLAYLKLFVTDARLSVSSLHQHILKNSTPCEVLQPLPEECFCSEPRPLGVVVQCLKTFNGTYFNDTIGIKMDLDPCDPSGSSMSLDITEKNHNISFPIEQIKANDEKNYPIPGLSIVVPGVTALGVDVAVLVSGNPDELNLQVGLNACASVHKKEICASSIPGLDLVLPWWMLKGTYSFGNVCNSSRFDEPGVYTEIMRD